MPLLDRRSGSGRVWKWTSYFFHTLLIEVIKVFAFSRPSKVLGGKCVRIRIDECRK
jgi:hypothetical protein